MEDVSRLLDALQALVNAGNTVLVIEHNTDVMKVADHIVDLGPEGEGGGQLVGVGTPEHIASLQHRRGMCSSALQTTPIKRPLQPDTDRSRCRLLHQKGVRTHNLRDVHRQFLAENWYQQVHPEAESTLAFHTLFSEGQQRYVESLSTYARRFLGRMGRAPVDQVGLAPAIAIDQRSRGHNPRSTVSTVTEIYDALRLLLPHRTSSLSKVQHSLISWSPAEPPLN